MSYKETQGIEFTYFTEEEDKLIQDWLKKKGHSWSHNTACGDCCRMYEDEYWVNGVGGKFSDNDEFIAYAKEKGISCNVDGYHITAA